ncbi:MAG TPA: hypothetical protein VNC11_13905, partial [Gemmatimonadaceae bacterium]|nr:hypothetical protein [Gemmatimonadaceae bacterium]
SGLARLFSGEISAAQQAAADSSLAAGTTSTSVAPSAPSTGGANAQTLREAQSHYDRAISAQRAGDWATYGREIKQLGDILKRLNTAGR